MTRTKENTMQGTELEAAAHADDKQPAKITFLGEKDGALRIAPSGDFSSIKAAAGGARVVNGMLEQIAALGAHGRRTDAPASNFVLGFVDAMLPRDAAECLLLTQMAAIHQATMMLARRLNHIETLAQQDSAERALNKLGRTFAAQMEALKRYRSTGQQKVVVEHVTVNAGGQAIVGTVTRGEGAEKE